MTRASPAAAQALLDRGWGRPQQAIEHSGGLVHHHRYDCSGLTDDELAALDALLDQAAGGGEDGPAVGTNLYAAR